MKRKHLGLTVVQSTLAERKADDCLGEETADMVAAGSLEGETNTGVTPVAGTSEGCTD
jgi:hypothetical protein